MSIEAILAIAIAIYLWKKVGEWEEKSEARKSSEALAAYAMQELASEHNYDEAVSELRAAEERATSEIRRLKR